MWLPFNIRSLYTFGNGAAAPTPPPTPPPSTTTTQTFQGFGGGFLGPHYKRKREEIYAKAELYGPPPVYRFNKRDLLPSLVFRDPLPPDPLLLRAALAAPASEPTPSYTIRGLAKVKIAGLKEYYQAEKKRKAKKHQKEEDELMLLL